LFEASKISLEDLQDALAALRPDFRFLADCIERAAEDGVWKDNEAGALLARPNPNAGPYAFRIILFPSAGGVKEDQLVGYLSRPIPSSFRKFLSCSNGGHFGDLSIYGVIPNLTRSARAPLDIGMGEIWRSSYAPCDKDLVLFASRDVSPSGQIGYFVSDAGEVLGRGNEQLDAPSDAGIWESLDDWFNHQFLED